MKKIVVVGTGRMGGAFATAFAERRSHTVAIRGSHPTSATAAALSRQLSVRVAGDKELPAADVVFVATPPAALDDVAAGLKGHAGIIVSAMVPGAGGYELKRDDGTSAAEQLARLVPKGRVVTAFTSIFSALIRDPASDEKPTVFTGADDEDARDRDRPGHGNRLRGRGRWPPRRVTQHREPRPAPGTASAEIHTGDSVCPCSFVPGLVPGTYGNRQSGWCRWMAGSKPGHERICESSVWVGTLAYGSGFGNRITLRAYVAS